MDICLSGVNRLDCESEIGHNVWSQDAEGVRLFRKFVGGAGGLYVDQLNFYFAVQGLRQEAEPAKIRQVVSAIYKSVLSAHSLPTHYSLPGTVRDTRRYCI